jgi:hypothetical protein
MTAKAKTIKYYGLQCATYKTGAMNCPNTRTMSGKVLEQTVLDELNSIIAQYCQSDEIHLPTITGSSSERWSAALRSCRSSTVLRKSDWLRCIRINSTA